MPIVFQRRDDDTVAIWLDADARDFEDRPGDRELGAPWAGPPEPDGVVTCEDVQEFVVSWIGSAPWR